jgi:hypothetical protein
LGFKPWLVEAQASQTAERVVKEFNDTTIFWKQFEAAKAIVALGDRRVR